MISLKLARDHANVVKQFFCEGFACPLLAHACRVCVESLTATTKQTKKARNIRAFTSLNSTAPQSLPDR